MQRSASLALILLLLLAAPSPPAAFAQSAAAPAANTLQAGAPQAGDQPLARRIKALLADPSAARSHWGIAVATLQGVPVYGQDEGRLFRPASNAKIFTTATAMALLGPQKTFTTRVFGNYDPATGTVTGDLTLAGGGDANFGADDLPYLPPESGTKRPVPVSLPPLADLASLADQLIAKGVRRITGNIVGDDTLYPYQPYAESWAQDDQIWGYGAPVSALTLDNNQLKLIVTPLSTLPASGGADANAATVQLEQNVPYYQVTAQVSTVPAGTPAQGVQIERLPGSRQLRVFGSMPAGAPPDVEEIAIADPARYAAMVLEAMLQQRGVAIAGSARVRHRFSSNALPYLAALLAPDPCDERIVAAEPAANQGSPSSCTCAPPQTAVDYGQLLASHNSAPLAEDVMLTNKVSQNLHAELFLHNLGRIAPCGSGSIVDGARLIRANLVHAGLDPQAFFFFDGSGLSEHDLVTPAATVKFLSYVASQSWFEAWKASLPDAGQDGTLSDRFPDPPVKGHLFAKTGTLGESRALSGFVDTAGGRTLIFSIFVDEQPPAGAADRALIDKIVTAIAEEK